MSEKLLRFLLGELETVRIKCLGTGRHQSAPCPMIFEIPVEQLGQTFPNNSCPTCGQTFTNPGQGPPNILDPLGKALGILKMMAEKKMLQIEFVLPDKD